MQGVEGIIWQLSQPIANTMHLKDVLLPSAGHKTCLGCVLLNNPVVRTSQCCSASVRLTGMKHGVASLKLISGAQLFGRPCLVARHAALALEDAAFRAGGMQHWHLAVQHSTPSLLIPRGCICLVFCCHLFWGTMSHADIEQPPVLY